MIAILAGLILCEKEKKCKSKLSFFFGKPSPITLGSVKFRCTLLSKSLDCGCLSKIYIYVHISFFLYLRFDVNKPICDKIKVKISALGINQEDASSGCLIRSLD